MNLPIGLTITRIVAVPFLILFLISSSRVHALIAAAIFGLAAATDWLDGLLARRRRSRRRGRREIRERPTSSSRRPRPPRSPR